MRKLYTETEIELLRKLWPIATTEELLTAFPGRTHTALIQKAKFEGFSLKRIFRHRRGDLQPLLNNTPEAWYWLGFFLADGHITKDGQFVVMLSSKDKKHLEKLARFLKSEVKIPYADGSKVRVTSMNKEVTDTIKTVLGLGDKPKTYNPPNVNVLAKLNDEQLECLFLGFFDGDGSVSATGSQYKEKIKRPNRGTGTIECHKSWKPIFHFFHNRGLVNKPKIGKKGFTNSYVPVNILQKLLAKYQNRVPLLERKWQGHMEILDGLRAKSL